MQNPKLPWIMERMCVKVGGHGGVGGGGGVMGEWGGGGGGVMICIPLISLSPLDNWSYYSSITK